VKILYLLLREYIVFIIIVWKYCIYYFVKIL